MARKHEFDKRANSLVGTRVESANGISVEILSWRVREHDNSDKNYRIYEVKCTKCGKNIFKKLFDIKKTIPLCRDCADKEMMTRYDDMIGKIIKPEHGLPTTILAWRYDDKNRAIYTCKCVHCEEPVEATISRLHSRQVVCEKCKNVTTEKNRKEQLKHHKKGTTIHQTSLHVPTNISRGEWKKYDDDKYQKMLAELNKNIGVKK